MRGGLLRSHNRHMTGVFPSRPALSPEMDWDLSHQVVAQVRPSISSPWELLALPCALRQGAYILLRTLGMR